MPKPHRLFFHPVLKLAPFAALLIALLALPGMAMAAGAADGAPHADGAALPLFWVIPFAGILLSIAILPLLAPGFWHRNFGKISAFWAIAFIVPFAVIEGVQIAAYEFVHVMLADYVPFIILLTALFTVAGGVRVRGALAGTPVVNTTMLLIGTAAASWMGTTGAAMLMIRPVMRANEGRKYQVHTIVFLIFLVANIGGSLTPLGDPPLFLGFLKGVDFFWPTTHMLLPMLLVSAMLLVLYFVIDTVLYRREDADSLAAARPAEEAQEKLAIEGLVNIPLLAAIVGAVLLQGVWVPGIEVTVYHVPIGIEKIASMGLLVLIALVSLRITDQQTRAGNGFTWFPMLEVAKLFAGIFVTIIPAIAILRAGTDGALGFLVESVTGADGQPVNWAYFWLTGILSSFLDNAPTYLVFFNTAGGNAAELMGPLEGTLLAISCGAVFMGAVSYIGNAPNFMVRAIAEEKGIRMPSFFGYMIWSVGILFPCFAVVTWVFFL